MTGLLIHVHISNIPYIAMVTSIPNSITRAVIVTDCYWLRSVIRHISQELRRQPTAIQQRKSERRERIASDQFHQFNQANSSHMNEFSGCCGKAQILQNICAWPPELHHISLIAYTTIRKAVLWALQLPSVGKRGTVQIKQVDCRAILSAALRKSLRNRALLKSQIHYWWSTRQCQGGCRVNQKLSQTQNERRAERKMTL